MTKEELKQEAEKWLRKFLLCNDCKRKCHCIELNTYCEEQVLKAYVDSAEPREKRIAELEEENADLKEEVNKIAFARGSLEEENAELKEDYEVLSCSVGDFGELQDKLEEEQRKNNGLSDNFTKAKEIINKFVELKNKPCAVGHSVNMLLYDNICAEAEQFLNSEVEN